MWPDNDKSLWQETKHTILIGIFYAIGFMVWLVTRSIRLWKRAKYRKGLNS